MKILHAFAVVLFASTALAQTGAPLPSNYKVILDNAAVQVQRVHYGPHESVPMHDHPAVSTIYVYLNDSGVVDIIHEKGFILHRPPTHTGAFRVSPGAYERHAVQNQSDLPSDFLRIELKKIPVRGLPSEFRGGAPKEQAAGTTDKLYENPALRVERTICGLHSSCTLPHEKDPSVLVIISLSSSGTAKAPAENPTRWLPAGSNFELNLNGGSDNTEALELLRIFLPKS